MRGAVLSLLLSSYFRLTNQQPCSTPTVAMRDAGGGGTLQSLALLPQVLAGVSQDYSLGCRHLILACMYGPKGERAGTGRCRVQGPCYAALERKHDGRAKQPSV